MSMQNMGPMSMHRMLQHGNMDHGMHVGGGTAGAKAIVYPPDDMHGHTHHDMDGSESSGGMDGHMNDDSGGGMGGDGGHMHHMDHMDHMDMHGGSGMVMYMDGFRSALFPPPHSDPPPCLNLFVPSWTLNTREKFVGAMMLVFVIGVCVEACAVWRLSLLRKHRRQTIEMRAVAADAGEVSSVGMTSVEQTRTANLRVKRWMRKRVRLPMVMRYDLGAAGVHALRALLGYVLMLAVMTYAIELTLSAVLGIVVGRFYLVDAAFASGGETAGGEETWGGEDPCCGMDDDFNGEEAADRGGLGNRNGGGTTVEPLLAQNDVEMLNGPGSMLRRNVGGQRVA